MTIFTSQSSVRQIAVSLLFVIGALWVETTSPREVLGQTLYVMLAADGTDSEQSLNVFVNDLYRLRWIIGGQMGSASDKKVCFYNHQEASTSDKSWSGPTVNQPTEVEDRNEIKLFTEENGLNVFDHIQEGFRNLKGILTPEDAVLFYWAGHGVMKDGEHYLATSDHSLENRNALIQSVKKNLKPRLLVFITDACADETATISGHGVALPIGGETSPLFNELFFQYTGVVDINAAERGQKALSVCMPNGSGFGLFGDSLVAVIQRYPSLPLTWNQFSELVILETQSRFQSYLVDHVDPNTGQPIELLNVLGVQTAQKPGIWELPTRINDGSIPYGGGRGLPRSDFKRFNELFKTEWDAEPDRRIEAGDRIVEIDCVSVYIDADFRQILNSSNSLVSVLTVVAHDSGEQFYVRVQYSTDDEKIDLCNKLTTSDQGGVTITEIESGSALARASYYFPKRQND